MRNDNDGYRVKQELRLTWISLLLILLPWFVLPFVLPADTQLIVNPFVIIPMVGSAWFYTIVVWYPIYFIERKYTTTNISVVRYLFPFSILFFPFLSSPLFSIVWLT